jgi:uncharacterized protein (TIGR02453 family)
VLLERLQTWSGAPARMATAHFSEETFEFLNDLKVNNRRDWFEGNRDRYRQHVQEPAIRFVTDFGRPLARLSRSYSADPRPNGGSIFRIYRDTRFSRDKTPYKTHVAMQFRHRDARDVHAPGYYVHLGLDGVFVGVGIWHPDSTTLRKIRDAIVAKPAKWRKVVGHAGFRDRFAMEGESLKRAPAGIDPEHPLIEDLKRKDFIGVAPIERETAIRPGFLEEVAATCRAGTPLVRYLCGSLDLTF